MNRQELFEKTVKIAKVILKTVPFCDHEGRYDMQDMAWILKDPFFLMNMFSVVDKYVERNGNQAIEDGVRVFTANMFSRQHQHSTIMDAKGRIKVLES